MPCTPPKRDRRNAPGLDVWSQLRGPDGDPADQPNGEQNAEPHHDGGRARQHGGHPELFLAHSVVGWP